MPEPEEPRFTCVGCGALNPVGAEVCEGCGHRFAGPAGEGAPLPSGQSRSAPIPPGAAPDGWSWVSSLLLPIVLVGVAAVLIAVSPWFGLLVVLAAVPAVARAVVVAIQARRAGKPIGLDGGMNVFARSLGKWFLVGLSSVIAFVATCFPIGLVRFDENGGGPGLGLAFGVGIASALLVGGGLVSWMARQDRRRKERDRP